MKPLDSQKSASRPDAGMRSRHNAATVPCTVSNSCKVGDSQSSSPFNDKASKTPVIGNPPECLRRDPRFNRSAPVGPLAIQGKGSPLEGAARFTDIKMPPSDKLAGDSSTPIFSPMMNHSPGNPGGFIDHFATNRIEMNTDRIRISLFCLDPHTWHGCCLYGERHGH